MVFTFELFAEEVGGASVHYGELSDAHTREEAAEQACFAFKGSRSAAAAQGHPITIAKRVVAYDGGFEFWRTTESEQTSCVELEPSHMERLS